MGRAPARNAEAIHGYCRVNRQPLAPATATVRTLALAVRQNPRQSTPAVTVTAMARGSSIPPASTGAPVLAGTAVQRIMIMPATA